MALIFSHSPLLQKVTRGRGLFSNELTAGNFTFCSASVGFLSVTSNNFQHLPDNILSTNYTMENYQDVNREYSQTVSNTWMEGLRIQSHLKQVQKSPEVTSCLTEQKDNNNHLHNTTWKESLNSVLPTDMLSGKVLNIWGLCSNQTYHCKKNKYIKTHHPAWMKCRYEKNMKSFYSGCCTKGSDGTPHPAPIKCKPSGKGLKKPQ